MCFTSKGVYSFFPLIPGHLCLLTGFQMQLFRYMLKPLLAINPKQADPHDRHISTVEVKSNIQSKIRNKYGRFLSPSLNSTSITINLNQNILSQMCRLFYCLSSFPPYSRLCGIVGGKRKTRIQIHLDWSFASDSSWESWSNWLSDIFSLDNIEIIMSIFRTHCEHSVRICCEKPKKL